jgi:hypothetical protein
MLFTCDRDDSDKLIWPRRFPTVLTVEEDLNVAMLLLHREQ